MFDSSISPSGLLERLVLRRFIASGTSPPTLCRWNDDWQLKTLPPTQQNPLLPARSAGGRG